MQINLFTKKINKKFSEERMRWTVPALNICIPAQHEILTMGGSDGQPEEKFVIYTIEDAKKLGKWIGRKLGVTQKKIEKKSTFKFGFWYQNGIGKKPKFPEPPSERLERGYKSIPGWIVDHQDVWDDAMEDDIIDTVVDVEEEEADTEEITVEDDDEMDSNEDSDEEIINLMNM